MAYGHGVYVSEVPTSIQPPVRSDAGLPVVFGTAPINMVPEERRAAAVNRPILCFSYAEAVAALGFAGPEENGRFAFSLSEFMRSHFALFAVSPVVFVNVLDPSKVEGGSADVEFVNGSARIPIKGILPESVGVSGYETNQVELTFASSGELIVHVAPDSGPAYATVNFDYLTPLEVGASEVIGGIDPNTGAATGLELLNEVFPRYRMVPGQVLAPGFSGDPGVAAVMQAKASTINGHFRAIALVDIPASDVSIYSDAPEWKNDNNIVDPLQVACWPMVELGGEVFHLSTQLAGVICRTDALSDGVPYKSPSNENLQASSMVLLEAPEADPEHPKADPKEVFLGPDQAAYLNGQGIVTGLNFIGGWKAWGNRTAAYPGITDPKDGFIAIRRMMNWIGNTLIQTFWEKVDEPLNRRQIDTVIDSANIWLNGLAARGFILGGRVEFLEDENPVTDLMDGISRFHVYVTPPSPNREIDFILEYDPEYLAGLF